MTRVDNEVVLVAPFIKHSIIEILLQHLKDKTKLTVYTRWRLDEILSGVSDIEIWELIRDSQNMSLKLSPNLHAKYYRFDNTVILGSANLTAKALITNAASNFELLQTSELNDECRSFEMALVNQSVEVNNELFKQVKRIVEQSEDRELSNEVNELGISYDAEDSIIADHLDLYQWIPRTRNPENLFVYYSKYHELLTDVQIKHAEIDLSFFPIKRGLNKEVFEESISFYLVQMPVIRKIDEFIIGSKSFGEMANFLGREFKLNIRDIDHKRSWQTLMRWLLYFISDKYDVIVNKYSEIIFKKK